ncbi:sigma 54-interacting transcriptional regulator [Sphingobium subterraneum]|uniref:Two-component system response regulator FlrC n=1 Tax=Sphingobium subterraneum TaxID=627688 RepID=A0A841IZE3_9SPHN|nr:sigma 54-interacting transcriptional regulator [Sphingobium subterraneum]MBB6123784.1 two-component system response regulator FlrC [Sphingobium subterraneum]
MSTFGMSDGLCARVPMLQQWLERAFLDIAPVAADAPRDRGSVHVLLASEIAHATYRDILVDYRDGAPCFERAASGLPARVGFGAADIDFACALIAELLRPSGLPAVGDESSARLMLLAGRIAASDATVLIQGDTGTGKEGMARFLHARSGRAGKDFIAVNCAALPETMMEAMLFGHKKGSFTGAANASDGLFLAADGGTLFLDEIAELPLNLQAKLLRALQEGEVLPVGATHPVPVNVRVIAACNRDLAAECDGGRFRSDLYWRLNVMPLALNPLATRKGDVLAISAAMLIGLHEKAPAMGAFPWPTKSALDRLVAHRWPGNARELGNVLHRAIVLREGERIEADDLSIAAVTAPVPAPAPAPANRSAPIRLQDIAKASKLDAIRHALRETDGHRALAARKLGISERTLRYRLAELREMAVA